MNNGIKFSSAETGALRIGGANLAPTQNSVENPSSYWTSVESSSCGYTIYLDRPNNAPSIIVVNNDNELITLTNQIANATYSTVVECLTYFNGESDKFVTNIEYPGILTNGLLLNLDAGFVPSYPKGGTIWKDLANGAYVSLVNGASFSTNKDSIVFDGVNDYVQIGTFAPPGTGDFITKWNISGLTASPPLLQFQAEGNVTYTWIDEVGLTGSGSFNNSSSSNNVSINVSGATSSIILSISSGITRIRSNGLSQGFRLLEIQQWGAAQWLNFNISFQNSPNVILTATDVPDLSNCTSLQRMFQTCTNFLDVGGRLGDWNTSTITNMSYMFSETSTNPATAQSFNSDISRWNVSKVTNMDYMLFLSRGFNQDLSSWCVPLIGSLPAAFDSDTTGWTNKAQKLPIWGTCPGRFIGGSNPFTISMWFKPDGTQSSGASLLCVANNADSTNWELSFTSNTLVFFTDASSSISTTYTPNDIWTNVVVVRNSTETDGLKIYTNGILRGQGTASTNFSDESGIRIGMNRGSNAFFRGEIGNTLIYNQALTEAEILQNYTVTKKIPTYLVRFFDIDGTILKEEFVDQGNDATAPSNPNIDPTYLVFAEWNQPFTNVQSDLDVGAMYDTVDGKTYIFTRITDTTGLQPTLQLNTSATLTVDWGDGTTNTTTTNGNVNVQKTAAYATIGDYLVTIDCAGPYVNIFNTPLYSTIQYASSVLKFYMGNMIFGQEIFRNCRSMSVVAMNKETYSGNYRFMFENCYSLKHINFPPSTSVGNSADFVNSCFSLKTISLPVLNTSVTFSNIDVFNACRVLQSIVWKNIIITGTACFQNCFGLQGNVVLNSGNTSIPDNTFNGCVSIDSVTMLGNITSVGTSAFSTCRSLRELEFPASLTSIAANAFANCSAIQEYTFLSTTPPTLANTNAFTGINAACKIYVPDASLSSYQAATNWVTYANYMYPLSTRPCK